jgi:flagellar protein FlaG
MDVAPASGPGPSAVASQHPRREPAPAPVPAAAGEEGAAERAEQRPPDLKFMLETADIQARFAIHEATNRVMITMYHRQTGEIVREIPPKRILDLLASLGQSGLIVDQIR